jgi:RNA polymerase subunit RPABC4/transcription elongation factor Spt4
MFKNVLRALEEFKSGKISVPIESDKDGYIDRECPSEECLYQFKIHAEDWKNIVRDEAVYCPMCKKEAPSSSWFTKEQIEQGREEAKKIVLNALNSGFKKDAKEFNARQPKNAFFSLKLDIKSGASALPILPIEALEEMELKINCKECNTRYAVLGSAFFCPSCGHNSAEETFASSLEKIKIKIISISTIQKTFNRDEAATLVRHLIESSLLDGVVAFQRFCELIFHRKNPTTNVAFNAFQRLDTGSSYWRNAFNEGYEDWLTPIQMNRLKIYFQQRHILAHAEGFVDQKYIDRSGDQSYVVGQRIVIKENGILDFLELLSILTNKISDV